MDGFALLIERHATGCPERAAEYDECLKRNLALPLIERVFVFCEGSVSVPEHEKIVRVDVSGRVGFRQVASFASERLAGVRCVVANADVYFDGTLSLLAERDMRGWLFALTRWESRNGADVHYAGRPEHSQDAWVFQAPLPEIGASVFGVLGCDNVLAKEAADAGMRLCNPYVSVRCRHLHASAHRTYSEATRLRGEYVFVMPSAPFVESKLKRYVAK